MGINWLAAVTYMLGKIPFEKMLHRPPSNSESIRELKEILESSVKKPVPVESSAPYKVEVKANANTTSKVTTKETVDYQNREMGKVLIQMERHAAQGLRIAGKPCDCLSKHLVDLEALAEETITMVSNPGIYLQIIEWVRSIAPKTTVEANESGLYAQEYPVIARQARDFRKELLGTLDYKVLFNTNPKFSEMPKETQDAMVEMVEKAAEKIKREKVTELEIQDHLAKTSENIPQNIPKEINVDGVGMVDAGIADNIKYLNDHGFKTIQSHSGLSSDHIGKNTEQGYISFFKSDLTPEKIRALKDAAERANLTWDEEEIFFQPAITVRTAKLRSGKGYYEVLSEANIESGLKPGAPDFMDKLKIREEIFKQKFQQNGGYLFTTDAENKAAFDQFIRNLDTLQNPPENAENLTGIPQPQETKAAKDDTKEPESDTPPASNGTACPNLQPMTEWVQSEDTAKCRECMLTITVPWYYEELEAQGEKELAEDLEKIQKIGDPVKVAAALDQIKEQVNPEVKQRLLEFDCASQSFET